ncbi:polyadenylate-binding protein 4-like isoform X1 [Ictalurus furcatus]|uniref:polyadenylate-binding protein 4-like isoform X1 n=1 Tax=Ictalurus furcatus TaxID=66913 RepID=UPI00234FE5A6|nr:polyadenylate-binding protein 4-like isoform X1 [Ictalurus furcatus]XP_053491654.1 polyadenylate-binding protein 4-like isoform X1 [Ictalurus furcatus]
MATLYVGDLHPDVTESMLLEKFSSVGRVCYLCLCLNTGTSLQYAFIIFQHRADAERALKLLNFDILLGQPMRIMWSQSDSSLRNSNEGNIFIKGLEKSIDSMALYDTFSIFGNILSCKVVCDENGSRGFGYVHFESAEAAEAAIKRLNGMLFNDHYVFITHFKSRQECQEQKKEERHPKPQHKFEQCVNLCLRNLDVSVDDERLHKEFSPFGTVIHAKVMGTDGCSGGFGFVRFSSPEEATKAMSEMQGRMLDRRALHIRLIQRKKERQTSLSSQGTQAAPKAVVNHHQPAPSCDKIMDAIPQAQNSTDNSTSVHQVKPHPSTHRVTQDFQLQSFRNIPEVIAPAVTHPHANQVVAMAKKTQTTVMDTVPAVVSVAAPTAAKAVLPTILGASIKAVLAVVPAAGWKPILTVSIKAVPAAVPAAGWKPIPTVSIKAVPAAVQAAGWKSIPTASIKAVPAAATPAPVIDEQLTKDTQQSQDTQVEHCFG